MSSSCDRAIINQPAGEGPRLEYESQAVPYTVKEVKKKATLEWPVNFANGVGISVCQKITRLEGCSFWSEEAWGYSVESNDALWRVYTASLVRTLMPDLTQKNLSL